MAHRLGWGQVAPFYVDLETPAPESGIPKPGPLDVHLRDDHMQYAITWFRAGRGGADCVRGVDEGAAADFSGRCARSAKRRQRSLKPTEQCWISRSPPGLFSARS